MSSSRNTTNLEYESAGRPSENSYDHLRLVGPHRRGTEPSTFPSSAGHSAGPSYGGWPAISTVVWDALLRNTAR